MDVLVLGGTRFLGRALVEAAAGRGDTVTMFNRGQTDPDLFPGFETITGDRTASLAPLAGRDWDVVVDVAAYDPDVARLSALALSGHVGRYVFVSTVSVYADQSTRQGQLEDAPVIELREGLDPGESYGARKATAEREVTGVFRDLALIARPGLIVGPHDPTDRWGYWPRRVARGGRVLAPGDPSDLAQFIDVRDLAGWIADAYHRGLGGTFNLTGVPMPFGILLEECRAATYGDAALTWVPSERLLAAGVEPWTGIPLWIAGAGSEAANDVDVSRALAAGLAFRPTVDTIRDTLAWDLGRGGPAPGSEGLGEEEERRLLRELAG